MFLFILRGMIFFCFNIISLSFNEKSPSGPIKIQMGSFFSKLILVFSVFKSPKIILVF